MALAAKHDKRARAAFELSGAALDALPRSEPDPLFVALLSNPSIADPSKPWVRNLEEDSVAVARLDPLNRPGAVEPGWDPAPTVKRQRRRWKPWRDKKGRARRSLETTSIEVPAHKAHAQSAAWHAARAGGQRHRMRHVGACGAGMIRVTCSDCGTVHEAPLACAVVRLCPGCNRRRSAKMRGRFATSVDVVLANAERAGMFQRRRPGGALGQHHITLTAPHVAAELAEPPTRPVGGAWGWVLVEHRAAFGREAYLERRKQTAKRRIGALLGAWRSFSRRLQAWLRQPWPDAKKKKAAPIGACWHRAFEWTKGDDGLGHPHFHLWALTPWIPEHDDHRIQNINGQATTRCEAPRPIAGAWGWAESMRRERCPMCVAGVPRRSGLRTWWADALAEQGSPVDERLVIVGVRKAEVKPQSFIREVQKSNGITYRDRVVKRLEMRDDAGRLINYFEAWCVAFSDAEPEVIAGVYESLEGVRLSQSSKVRLQKKDGSTKTLGLLGIADGLYDASCRDCNDAESLAGRAPLAFPDRKVEVMTATRVAGARIGAPPLPPATAPPVTERVEDYQDVVARLQREEHVREHGARELARAAEICELIRTEGAELLPSYRRQRARRPGPRTIREKMTARARQARKRA